MSMHEKNNSFSTEESKEQDRSERRRIKRNPKMKMTGKGMKRFANPKKITPKG